MQLKYPKNNRQLIILNLVLVNLLTSKSRESQPATVPILRRVAISHSSKRGTHKILDLLHRKTRSICDNWTDNWAVITTNLAEEENTHSATSLCASTVSTLTVHSFTRLPLDAEPESVNRFNYRKANVKFEEVCAKSQARFAWILSLVCACVCDYFWHWLCHCWCAALCGCSSILFREMWNDAKRWPSVGRLCSLCLCVCLGLFIWVMHRSSLKGKHAACAVCHLPHPACHMPHAEKLPPIICMQFQLNKLQGPTRGKESSVA